MKKAPFADCKKAGCEVLSKHRAGLTKGWQNKIASLSDLYALVAREAASSSVYTPPDLAKELYVHTPRFAGDHILDCSAGTGNLSAPFLKAGCDVTLMDTDPYALTIAALEQGPCPCRQEDFLTSSGEWDIIIGNPPYAGQKSMNQEEKAALRRAFPAVMGNKADLHYAFFAKAHSLLKDGGILSFLVSRYWLEAESARELRRFILSSFRLLYLHDWYGERPFGAGVDPLLIVLRKEETAQDYEIAVRREDAGAFHLCISHISEDSMKLLTRPERALRDVFDRYAALTLGEAGDFSQGIITGCDEAFITTVQKAKEKGIEADLLVPWFKSADLKTGSSDKKLIYADEQSGEYPGFMHYIEPYREKLSQRREVRLGRRAFHELQWGRQKNIFEARRLLFPYKGSASLFVTREGIFHSADVYSYTSDLSLDWLALLLNSPLYDLYIKTGLKKLGRDLYEYYPHRLRHVRIPDPARYPDPEVFLELVQSEWDKAGIAGSGG